MECPPPGTEEYLARVIEANDGTSIAFARQLGRRLSVTEVPSVEHSAIVLSAEIERLRSLGYERAIGPNRFAALRDRLVDGYDPSAPMRRYQASIRTSANPESITVVVQARSPFEARFAMLQAYPGASLSMLRDRDRPPLKRDKQTLEIITAPEMPSSDATLELIVARAANDGTGFELRRSEPYLAAEYRDFGDLRPFRGSLQVGATEFELVVNARSRYEAEVAAIAEVGDGYGFRPYADRGPWWQNDERLATDRPSSDSADFVDVPSLPYGEETVDRILESQDRLRSQAARPEKLEERKRRLANRYFKAEPSDMLGYVVADGVRTFVRIAARLPDEARLALRDNYGEFAPMSIWPADNDASPTAT